jgi:hypothetical protein
MEDMIQIKLAVEGMRAQIVKVFSVQEISQAIEKATDKVVADFDMEVYIKSTIIGVFNQAREKAIEELSQVYGAKWASDVERIVDEKISKALANI